MKRKPQQAQQTKDLSDERAGAFNDWVAEDAEVTAPFASAACCE